MSRLKGITITLINKIENGEDPFGNPILVEKEIKANNVLVGQPTTEDITN